jgi:hypothetical protein
MKSNFAHSLTMTRGIREKNFSYRTSGEGVEARNFLNAPRMCRGRLRLRKSAQKKEILKMLD